MPVCVDQASKSAIGTDDVEPGLEQAEAVRRLHGKTMGFSVYPLALALTTATAVRGLKTVWFI